MITYKQFDFLKREKRRKSSSMLWHLWKGKDNSWAITFGVHILSEDALRSELFKTLLYTLYKLYIVFDKTQALFSLVKTKQTLLQYYHSMLVNLSLITGNCLALLCLLLPAAPEHCPNTASAPNSRCWSYTRKQGKDTAAATSERLGSSTPGEKRQTQRSISEIKDTSSKKL